ncbi:MULTISPECIES: xanthine dehydrogenase family protein molybdopterin-binding subunit [unclassified Modestobacter]|uniref:xanthine dehydrogenase family protein molybdopterin-binding subunit n=1 Tax=unclassified Modestobacter TaxID=2643866 RepID=UPI0022AA0CC7|nr:MULTISPECIES: molybdopterin cofactor-binding domain-containing protein [unclassified Modestobacter]MCZ2825038.1 molybdopterin-dependent oxidoreductase [Modestobacter sp. VKM Ac-2981]MCZ2854459.1 molybdopterin-dependent oxidoreductase [Modestobacter sp. VKM Ac-2982]
MRATVAAAAPRRLEGARKVAGRAPYAADAVPQPHLFGGVVESPVVGPVSVDLTAAEAVTGVVAALGPPDDPGVLWCPNPHGTVLDTLVFTSQPRFVGDVVGAVVAETRAALEAALALVVVTPRAAEQPAGAGDGSALDPLVGEVCYGDDADTVERALLAAPHVFTATYTVDAAPHGYLERPCAAAQWAGDGSPCRIWSTTQVPGPVAARVARILSLTAADVVLEPVYVGGGFGGKEEIQFEPAAALLSRAAGGRPVLLEITRSMTNGRFRVRHGASVTLRTGVDDDGVLLVRDVVLELDAGGYSGHSPDVAAAGAARALVLYPAPVSRSVGRATLSATTPATGFRGYGGTETLFAVESQIDEIADALGHDRVVIRSRNVLRQGASDPLHAWPVLTFSAEACLREAVRRSEAWPAPTVPNGPPGRWRTGRGIALLLDTSSKTRRTGPPDGASARCRLTLDGALVVETGSTEIGQGNHTAFAVVAAEALGVAVEDVRVDQPSTATAPEDPGAYGARGAYVTAGAVVLAARGLLDRIVQAVVERTGCAATDVEVTGSWAGSGADRIPLADLAPLAADAAFRAPDNALCAGAQVAEIVVDTATGVVRVTRVVSVHDVGRVLHRTLATGQVVGGVVQGVGTTVTERLARDEQGVPFRGTFLDHLLPTVADAPEVDVVFVTVPHPHSPTGAKGLGEAPVMGMAPAIANAVADATGVRVRSLPMHPERLLAALDARQTEGVRA